MLFIFRSGNANWVVLNILNLSQRISKLRPLQKYLKVRARAMSKLVRLGPVRVLRPQVPSRACTVPVVGFNAVGVAYAEGSNHRSMVRSSPERLPSLRQSAKALTRPPPRGPPSTASLLPARNVNGLPLRKPPVPLIRHPPRRYESAPLVK